MSLIQPAKIREYVAAQSDALRAETVTGLAGDLRTTERRIRACTKQITDAAGEVDRIVKAGIRSDYPAEMAAAAGTAAFQLAVLVAERAALLAELGRMGVDVNALRG